MRDDESSHDVVYMVKNVKFLAHSCFMDTVSPVLHKMLTNGMKKTNEREVVLKKVNLKVWKVILGCIYSAKVELSNAEEAVQVSNKSNDFK